MHARVATFEGDAAALQASIDGIKERAQSGPPEGVPATAFLILFNKAGGRVLAITLFDSEEDLNQGDQALSAMSPPDDGMKRVSVDRYEVPIKLEQ